MAGILNKITGKSNANPSNANATTNTGYGSATSNVPKTDSMIIDEAVPQEVNVAGPTTVEYDLEGKPRPEIPSMKSANHGRGEPSVELLSQNQNKISSPTTSTSNPHKDNSSNISHTHGNDGLRTAQGASAGEFDPGFNTASGTTDTAQLSSKYDTTTTTGNTETNLDPSSRKIEPTTADFDSKGNVAATQPGHSMNTTHHGYASGTTTQPGNLTDTTATSVHPGQTSTTHPSRISETPGKTATTKAAPELGHRRRSSSSSKKSNDEDSKIIDKIKNKLHIGSSKKEKNEPSHAGSALNTSNSNKYRGNLGVRPDDSAAGAAAAYSKLETSSGYGNTGNFSNTGASLSDTKDHKAAVGSTNPTHTRIPGRDTNTKFADFADTTSPQSQKREGRLDSGSSPTSAGTGAVGAGIAGAGIAGTGLHNKKASSQPDHSLDTTHQKINDPTSKYDTRTTSGAVKDKADPSSHAYNDPTSKYDTSTTTGKIKDKLDPSSHSHNDPTSKYDTSTATGKIKDMFDSHSHGVEPSGYAVDESHRTVAGSTGTEPSGYGLKSSNHPTTGVATHTTSAEPSGYGIEPTKADQKFATNTTAEPSGYGLESSKKQHLGTVNAGNLGASSVGSAGHGVGTHNDSLNTGFTSSGNYDDPTSKYDTSTTTGKIKDKLDPSSHAYNDPTSKYNTSTATGNVMDKLNPYSHESGINTNVSGRDSEYHPGVATTGAFGAGAAEAGKSHGETSLSSNRNIGTEGINITPSKYDTTTTTGKVADKLDPTSNRLADDKGTKTYHTGTLGNTHASEKLGSQQHTSGHSGISSSGRNVSGIGAHDTTHISASQPTDDSRQYGHNSEYLGSIPGGYPEKSYYSGTGTDFNKSSDLTTDRSLDTHNSSTLGEAAHNAGAGLLAAGATATAGVAAVGNAAYNKIFGHTDTGVGATDAENAKFDSATGVSNTSHASNKYSSTDQNRLPGSTINPESTRLAGNTDSTLGNTNVAALSGSSDLSGFSGNTDAPYTSSNYGSGITGHGDRTGAGHDSSLNRNIGQTQPSQFDAGSTARPSGYAAGHSTSKSDSHYNDPTSKYDTSKATGRAADKLDPTSRKSDTHGSNEPSSVHDTKHYNDPVSKYDTSKVSGRVADKLDPTSRKSDTHGSNEPSSVHDTKHYNDPTSKYDTSKTAGRVADKLDPTSRKSDTHGSNAPSSVHDTKHFNDPTSKYDTSKMAGRVADKLDPNSRNIGTTASKGDSVSTGNDRLYEYNKDERQGDVSPTLKYSDRSDNVQSSRLDPGYPAGAGLAAASTNYPSTQTHHPDYNQSGISHATRGSGNIPVTRGEEFLSDKEKNLVQEHFGDVNRNLRPGQPEVAGVAVLPLTQEEIQNATPRSQKIDSPSENTDASTKKHNISKSGYDVRT